MGPKDQSPYPANPVRTGEEPTAGQPTFRSDPTTDPTGTPPTTKTGRKGDLEPGEVGPLPT
jgi:hypothetical protein